MKTFAVLLLALAALPAGAQSPAASDLAARAAREQQAEQELHPGGDRHAPLRERAPDARVVRGPSTACGRGLLRIGASSIQSAASHETLQVNWGQMS